PAGGNTQVLVPVRNRVSSGESGLTITVSDTAMDYVSGTSMQPLTIRSSIETVGLWVLSTLAALLLIFGTVRSLRRRRKRRTSTVPPPEGSPSAASEGSRLTARSNTRPVG